MQGRVLVKKNSPENVIQLNFLTLKKVLWLVEYFSSDHESEKQQLRKMP